LTVATPADPGRLLGQVADALNACERAGLVVQLAHGTVVTGHGYVLPVGDPRLGARWQARTLLPAPGSSDEEADRGDHVAG
jgi:hypothetical protein